MIQVRASTLWLQSQDSPHLDQFVVHAALDLVRGLGGAAGILDLRNLARDVSAKSFAETRVVYPYFEQQMKELLVAV